MIDTAPKSAFITEVEEMLDQYHSLYDGNCPYVLNERLTLEQIEQFESSAHIVLPQDYKDFLLYIGNGGKHAKQFPLSLSHAKGCLEESLRKTVGLEYMSLPFSLDKCNRCFDDDLDETEDDTITDDDVGYDQMITEALHGTITVHNDGCGYFIVMIVSGELAGKLYYIDTCNGQGTRFVSDSFAAYYLKWLNQQMTRRLAYLEQNDKFECVITDVKLGGNVRDLHVRKLNNDFLFQFEYFCPGDFMLAGGYSEYTKVNDHLVVSLYMEHVSFSALELTQLDNNMEPSLSHIGDRSLHEVIGRVNRLFTHDIGGNHFPLYVEGLEQEILIKGAKDIAVSVGDVYKIRGRLSGEVYRITR
ncbi:SMI1/KNR4 family protein [Brevibacillus sp. HB1.3]|uniref:SMI1/KNR4 family protein n=1 Tax=Brevibacillus sp. HB1.3 TaxID=2738842 RepID=UPI001557E608|nr:SMI1/KNR4 family protein [Brevibacillus sp. HB1.3]NQF15709.1 SMI1/KNR4 family protein [Brevibacillus sp. HB1.3]